MSVGGLLGAGPFSHALRQHCAEVSRAPVGLGMCPCIVPKGDYWLSSEKRFLSSSELLALQGWGADEMSRSGALANAGEALQKDLAGNAFSSNVASVVLLSMLCHWPRQCRWQSNMGSHIGFQPADMLTTENTAESDSATCRAASAVPFGFCPKLASRFPQAGMFTPGGSGLLNCFAAHTLSCVRILCLRCWQNYRSG